ncbi:MAG: hypothetical protein ACYC54_07725 [Sedimentisphaerales bacterium]
MAVMKKKIKSKKAKNIKFNDIVKAIDEELINDEQFMTECFANGFIKAEEIENTVYDMTVNISDDDGLDNCFEQIKYYLYDGPKQRDRYSVWILMNINYLTKPNLITEIDVTKNHKALKLMVHSRIQDMASMYDWKNTKNVHLKVIRKEHWYHIFDMPENQKRIIVFQTGL